MWENQLKNDAGFHQKITVNGTDFLCNPPSDGDDRCSWISHKFKKPAVFYKIGISIQSGDIVWVNSPWRAGCYPDITIFQLGGLKNLLFECGERAEVDKGHCGEPSVIDLPNEAPLDMLLAKKKARMRYEMCNKCFKNWACPNTSFRHGVDLHSDCMYAVAVLTQLTIEDTKPLFDTAFVNVE